jgi:hypothetical protein
MSEAMISRRKAFLGLAAVAAPFVIRTPGLLMPVRCRLSAALIARREAERRRMLGTARVPLNVRLQPHLGLPLFTPEQIEFLCSLS